MSLTSFKGKAIPAEEFAGKTVVLHFWNYQGKLAESYGQVGYLDFLVNQNRRIDRHIKVHGVAVDEPLSNPEEASASKRAIRQFREFFNLMKLSCVKGELRHRPTSFDVQLLD